MCNLRQTHISADKSQLTDSRNNLSFTTDQSDGDYVAITTFTSILTNQLFGH